MAAAASTVAEDLNDLTGKRGYGMGMGGPVDQALLLGQLPAAKEDRERALRDQCLRKDGNLVPWFEPLRLLVKVAKRKAGDMGAEVRSVIALGESGLWTQLRRRAEGHADHPYCQSCGPFGKWASGGEQAVGEEAVGEGERAGGRVGAVAGQEDVNWGAEKAGEARAGCRWHAGTPHSAVPSHPLGQR